MGERAPSQPGVPPAGVWAPAVTFFDPDSDELDLAAQTKYYRYLSQHLTGLVILGTNAETFLLTREERASLLRTAREAVGPHYPLMAGVGGHSTKQVLEFIDDAHRAGADYVLVLPCAYFGKQTTPAVVSAFYDAVAEQSPLPVVLYNFPGVCNGVDLESDAMLGLACSHPGRIVGTKLTCASVGKLTRLAAQPDPPFAAFGGQSDFLLAGLAVGSAGCIAAFANVFPRTLRRIYDLHVRGGGGDAAAAEALRLQRVAATAEAAVKAGVAAVKFATSLTSARAAGIDGAERRLRPRHPYEPPSEAVQKDIRARLEEMIAIENSL